MHEEISYSFLTENLYGFIDLPIYLNVIYTDLTNHQYANRDFNSFNFVLIHFLFSIIDNPTM